MDPSQQVITLLNERFMVPEALFYPSDIGLRQGGIAECMSECLNMFPLGVRDLLIQNIVMTGGNTCMPGFKDRFIYLFDLNYCE